MHSHFRAQEVIFRERETANRFYLIERIEAMRKTGAKQIISRRAALYFHKPLNISVVIFGAGIGEEFQIVDRQMRSNFASSPRT